jgi:hypothetical protein
MLDGGGVLMRVVVIDPIGLTAEEIHEAIEVGLKAQQDGIIPDDIALEGLTEAFERIRDQFEQMVNNEILDKGLIEEEFYEKFIMEAQSDIDRPDYIDSYKSPTLNTKGYTPRKEHKSRDRLRRIK